METSLSRLGILHAAEIKVIDSPDCLPIGLPLFRLDHLFHHMGHLCAILRSDGAFFFSGFNHLNTKMTEQDIYRRSAEAYAAPDQGGNKSKTQELIQKIFQDAFDAGFSFEEIDASLHDKRSCG